MSERKAVSYASKKGVRGSPAYARRRQIFRKRPLNRYELEKQGEGSVSAHAKLVKPAEDVDVDPAFGYRILNFVAVFAAICAVVRCKACGSSVRFTESAKRGLGFKVIVSCDNCAATSIPNSPMIGGTYEVNRRMVLAMRLLGIGRNGIEKFCAFMELPCPLLRSFYGSAVEKVALAAGSVARSSMRRAVAEEKEASTGKSGGGHLTVSGDGSWRESASSSIDGVVTLIGWFTGKVIDLAVKSKHCEACELWRQKSGTAEYEEWREAHNEVCQVSNDRFTGKAEDDAVVEMFKRSQTLYDTKYENFVGEGDPKNYKPIPDARPYEDVAVVLKENIDHAVKRMIARLRDVKKVMKSVGEDQLTGKLMDELSTHYGQAIRQHGDSSEKVRDAVYAALLHRASTDKKPQHQRAKASNSLAEYKHEPAVSQAVFNAVKRVLEELSGREVLAGCVDGSVERSKECFNATVWSMAPKAMSKAFDIATCVAVCVCNDGLPSVMQVMRTLGMTVGMNCHNFCVEAEARRVPFALGKSSRWDEENESDLMGQLYGAGLD